MMAIQFETAFQALADEAQLDTVRLAASAHEAACLCERVDSLQEPPYKLFLQRPTPHPVNHVPEPAQFLEPIQEMVRAAPAAPSVEALDMAATARYEQLLVAWLEKDKKYPRRAKRLRIEGEGMLCILINREGQTQQITLYAFYLSLRLSWVLPNK